PEQSADERPGGHGTAAADRGPGDPEQLGVPEPAGQPVLHDVPGPWRVADGAGQLAHEHRARGDGRADHCPAAELAGRLRTASSVPVVVSLGAGRERRRWWVASLAVSPATFFCRPANLTGAAIAVGSVECGVHRRFGCFWGWPNLQPVLSSKAETPRARR